MCPSILVTFSQLTVLRKAAVIIRRGRRSLGYGFIEFAKHEDAVKSVGVNNTKEFLGRPLKVEIARPETEKPPRPERAPRPPKPDTTEIPNPVKPTPKPKTDAPAQNAGEGEKGPARRFVNFLDTSSS